MPISQVTVLELYGEVHRLVRDIENARLTLSRALPVRDPDYLQSVMREVIESLEVAAIQGERDAVTIILRDAPAIEVNPLTGEVE